MIVSIPASIYPIDVVFVIDEPDEVVVSTIQEEVSKEICLEIINKYAEIVDESGCVAMTINTDDGKSLVIINGYKTDSFSFLCAFTHETNHVASFFCSRISDFNEERMGYVQAYLMREALVEFNKNGKLVYKIDDE